MRISKPLIYCNVVSLFINGVIVWLVVTKTFPAFLGITLVIAFIAGATWLSCWMNEALPSQRRERQYDFYSGPTEKVERL